MAKSTRKDMGDDEFRVIGRNPKEPEKKTFPWLWVVLAVLVAIIATIVLLITPVLHKDSGETGPGLFEQQTELPSKPAPIFPLGAPVDSTSAPCVELIDTAVNDVMLSIYIPHNATPILSVGNPSSELRKTSILAFQAADIRADNRKILGAFVLKGEPLAWGLSKKGFVAIIDGKVTIGVSENSPLFEEATEKGGYFFRQYPLVDNGVLCENELKGKSIRKAICERTGQIFVAVSESDESMHDFSQALIDLGVNNAVFLVGSRFSFGWWKADSDSEPAYFGEDIHTAKYKNESYIIWK